MELRQLRWMLVVAEELHFGRAAARLHVTASALSQQIARLEREVGVALFDRSPRRVRLTAAGAVLAVQIRSVLVGVERAVAAARAAASGSVRLVVGFTSHGPGEFLTPLVEHFTQRFPHALVDLRELDFGTHFTALERGLVDAQFVRLPLPTPSDVRIRLLAVEPRVVAVGQRHALSRGTGPVTAQTLSRQVFFRLPPEVPKAWSDHFAPWGAEQNAPLVATVGEALTSVAAGRGVVLLPASLARALPRTDVVYRPAAVEPSRLAIAWRCVDPSHGPRSSTPTAAPTKPGPADEVTPAASCVVTDAFADLAVDLAARHPELLGAEPGVQQ